MLDLVKSLFTSNNADEMSVGQRLIKGADSLIYTDQEKAEQEKSLIETQLEFTKVMMADKDQNSRKTRRLIAIAIVFCWLPLWFVMCSLSIYALITAQPYFGDLVTLIATISLIPGTVISFYFGMGGKYLSKTPIVK